MRGRGWKCGSITPAWRITPAYAGKSGALAIAHRSRRDHPRVCGEEYANVIMQKGGVRITPAYAGKRNQRTHCRSPLQDHPRVCGEEVWWLVCRSGGVGSPPRMRGRVSQCPASRAGPGITPAYAGTSHIRVVCGRAGVDHPRVCGEEVWRGLSWAVLRGSPPRMRGRVHVRMPSVCLDGITPAYAGKREPAVRRTVTG